MRVVGRDKGLERVEVLDPGRGKGLVVEIAGEQFVDHGEVEGVIRARAHHEEGVGLGRRDRRAHVDAGDLGPGVLGVEQVVDLLDVDRLEDVARLEHHVFAVLVVVGHVLPAEAEQGQGGVLHVARAGGIMVAVVGAAEGLQKGPVHVAEGAAAVGEQDGARAVGFLDAGKLPGHVGQRLVPGRLAPFALAALAGADHGELRPFVVGNERRARRAAGAKGPLDARGVGVALQMHDLVAGHGGHHGAAHRAHAADAIDLGVFHDLLQSRRRCVCRDALASHALSRIRDRVQGKSVVK